MLAENFQSLGDLIEDHAKFELTSLYHSFIGKTCRRFRTLIPESDKARQSFSLRNVTICKIISCGSIHLQPVGLRKDTGDGMSNK